MFRVLALIKLVPKVQHSIFVDNGHFSLLSALQTVRLASLPAGRIRFTQAVAMILRVWALYGRSKVILGSLLTVYIVEVITTLAYSVSFSTVNKPLGM